MGRVYIADTSNNRIRRIELDGTITTVAGTGRIRVLRRQRPRDQGGARKARWRGGRRDRPDLHRGHLQQPHPHGRRDRHDHDGRRRRHGDVLQNPNGVAVDANNGVVIADTYNRRIRRVDLATGTLTTMRARQLRLRRRRRAGDGGDAVVPVQRHASMATARDFRRHVEQPHPRVHDRRHDLDDRRNRYRRLLRRRRSGDRGEDRSAVRRSRSIRWGASCSSTGTTIASAASTRPA